MKYNYFKFEGTFELPESISIDEWIDKVIDLVEANKGTLIGYWEDTTEENRIGDKDGKDFCNK